LNTFAGAWIMRDVRVAQVQGTPKACATFDLKVQCLRVGWTLEVEDNQLQKSCSMTVIKVIGIPARQVRTEPHTVDVEGRIENLGVKRTRKWSARLRPVHPDQDLSFHLIDHEHLNLNLLVPVKPHPNLHDYPI
jgi:hypothetical protein